MRVLSRLANSKLPFPVEVAVVEGEPSGQMSVPSIAVASEQTRPGASRIVSTFRGSGLLNGLLDQLFLDVKLF
jgi:hypothetical protein